MAEENPDSTDAAGEGQTVNQNVNISIEQADTSPSIILRGVYFLLFGWWASGVWLGIAWFLNLTIVLMPIGIKMINKVPKIVSLKDRPLDTDVIEEESGDVTIKQSTQEQYSLLIRGVYFLLIGWWASFVWMAIAWVLSITIIGLPAAVWMYDRLPFVVSLYRY
jgi:uncharacterized membrane protein YccF (DUF307 family)